MKYDIAFLSRIIPREIEAEVRSKMIGLMEDAAMAWQWNIIEGLELNNDGPVSLFNYLPVNAYPNTYKDPYIRMRWFSHMEDAKDINLGYCNIKYIKRLVQWIPLHKELKKWAQQNRGCQKVLIAYTMYPEFMRAVRMIKKRYPNIITINIVVDMPQFTVLSNRKKSLLGHLYTKWSETQAFDNIQYLDGIVPITKQMAKELASDKPHTIVEGICTTCFPKRVKEIDETVKILYAGMLHEKFGIIKLLDAFKRILDDNFRLYICGIGEAEEEIKAREQKDNRIKYLGKLSRDEVLELITKMDVIVNPRENIGEFTKYSFPSKDMEALSSGIPFVGYKLDGIPEEYDEYINYPKDDTVEGLAATLEEVGKDINGEAAIKALNAQNWVCECKSPATQGKRILEMIEEIQSL